MKDSNWHRMFLAVVTILLFLASVDGRAQEKASTGIRVVVVEIGEPFFESGWTAPTVPPLPGPDTRTSQPYTHGNPSNEEQLMLELINASRADPAGAAAFYGVDLNQGLAPGTISPVPKQPLAFNPSLIIAARNHSQWMLSAQDFDHTGQGGSSPGDRMAAAGYVFSGSWSNGENIGWSGTTGNMSREQKSREIIENLFLSPGHRTNTLGEGFEEIGIGGLVGVFQGYNAMMVTENFARSASTPTPMLLGVVYDDRNGNGRYDPGEGVQGVTIRPDRGSYHAVTSTSGGYAIPVPGLSGGLYVTASGGAVTRSRSQSVTLTGRNVKVDFVMSGDSDGGEVSDAEKSRRVLDWMEYLFPWLGPSQETVLGTMRYRYYPENELYLVSYGGTLYYMLPSGEFFVLGSLDELFIQAQSSGF